MIAAGLLFPEMALQHVRSGGVRDGLGQVVQPQTSRLDRNVLNSARFSNSKLNGGNEMISVLGVHLGVLGLVLDRCDRLHHRVPGGVRGVDRPENADARDRDGRRDFRGRVGDHRLRQHAPRGKNGGRRTTTETASNPLGTTPPAAPVVTAPGEPLINASSDTGHVVFTFDDGPGIYTPTVLAELKLLRIPGAIFFDIGEKAGQRPNLVRAELAAGDLVGNHTWDHQSLTGKNNGKPPLTPAQVRTELTLANAGIMAVGAPSPPCTAPRMGRSAPLMTRSPSRWDCGWSSTPVTTTRSPTARTGRVKPPRRSPGLWRRRWVTGRVPPPTSRAPGSSRSMMVSPPHPAR